VQELRHEIQAYEDFCAFRRTHAKEATPEAIEQRRHTLQMRMRRRRRKERELRVGRAGRGASRGSRPRFFGLF
jgi:hypothetical protein